MSLSDFEIHQLANAFVISQKGRTFSEAMTAVSAFVNAQSEVLSTNLQWNQDVGQRLTSECHCYLAASYFPAVDEKFEVKNLLGVGGNGCVFLVSEREDARRQLALKLRKTEGGAIATEIRVLGQLTELKPSVAALIETLHDKDGSIYGFSMDFIAGESLRSVIATTSRAATTLRDRADSVRSVADTAATKSADSDSDAAQQHLGTSDSLALSRILGFTPVRFLAYYLVSWLALPLPWKPRLFHWILGEISCIEFQKQRYREAAELGFTVSTVMTAVHANGVIHRDLKPENLLRIDRDIRIIDFGLSRIIHRPEFPRTLEGDDIVSSFSTNPVGTRLYMSPEQFRKDGEPLKPTDVFSLGLILHEFITGNPANSGTCQRTIAENANHIPELLVLDPFVPKPINAIVRRATAPRAIDRPTMGELSDELRRYLDGFPTKSWPIPRALRIALWTRRNPIIAALSFFLATFVFLGLIAALHYHNEQKREFDLLTANSGLDTVERTLEQDPGAALLRIAEIRRFNPAVSDRATEIQVNAARRNHVLFEQQSDLTTPKIRSLPNSPLTAFFCSHEKKLQVVSCAQSASAVADVKLVFETSLEDFSDFQWDSQHRQFLIFNRSKIPATFSVHQYDQSLDAFTEYPVAPQVAPKNPTTVYSERLEAFLAFYEQRLWKIVLAGARYNLQEVFALPEDFKATKVAVLALKDGSLLCIANNRAFQISDTTAGGWHAIELDHVSESVKEHFSNDTQYDLHQLSDDRSLILVSGKTADAGDDATILLTLNENLKPLLFQGLFTAPELSVDDRVVFAILSRGTAIVREIDREGVSRELLSLHGVDRLSFNKDGTSIWYSRANEKPATLYFHRFGFPEPRSIPVPRNCMLISLSCVQLDEADCCFTFTDGDLESRMIRLLSPLSLSERYSPELKAHQTFVPPKSTSDPNPDPNLPVFTAAPDSVSFMIYSEHQTQILELDHGRISEKQVLPGAMIDPTFDNTSLLTRHSDLRKLSRFKKIGDQFTQHSGIDTAGINANGIDQARYLRNCNAVLYRTEDHLFLRKDSAGVAFPVSKWHSNASLHDFNPQSLANGKTCVLVLYKDGSAALTTINSDLTIQTIDLALSGDISVISCATALMPMGLRAALLGSNGELTVLEINTHQNSTTVKKSFEATLPALERRATETELTRLIFSPIGRYLLIAAQTEDPSIWLLDLVSRQVHEVQVPLPDRPRVLAQWMSSERILFISTEDSLARLDLADNESEPVLVPAIIKDARPNNLVIASVANNEECLLSLEQFEDNSKICVRDNDGRLQNEHPVKAAENAALRISDDQRFLATTIKTDFIAKIDADARTLKFHEPVTQHVFLYHSHDPDTQIVFYQSHCEVFSLTQPPSNLPYTSNGKKFSVAKVQPLRDQSYLLLTGEQPQEQAGEKEPRCFLMSLGKDGDQKSLKAIETFLEGDFVTSDGTHIVSRSKDKYCCYIKSADVLSAMPILMTLQAEAGLIPVDSHAQVHDLPSGQTVLMVMDKETSQISWLVFEPQGPTKFFAAKEWKTLPTAESEGIHDFLLQQNRLLVSSNKGICRWHFQNTAFQSEERLHLPVGEAWLLNPPVNMAAFVATRDRLILVPDDSNIQWTIRIPYSLEVLTNQPADFFRLHRTWHCENNGSPVVIVPGEKLECWPLACFYANAPGQPYPGAPSLSLAPRGGWLNYEKKLFPRLWHAPPGYRPAD